MPGPGTQQSKGNPIQDYVTVAERIEQFYEKWPEGRINTHIVEHDAERGFILMRAEVYRNADDALPSATGHAYELKSEGYVQRTSYIEVCETSSVGRALAMVGFEVKRGIAGGPPPAKPAPVAASGGMITDEQKTAILNIAHKKGVAPKTECRRAYKKDIDELTNSEAADFISGLQNM